MKTFTLYCVPYAGGSAAVYANWTKDMDQNILVKQLELPGRGRRFREPLIENVPGLVEDLYLQINNSLDGNPYAIFGHSLGSLLAYELSYLIQSRREHRLPEILFLSGQNPPHRKDSFIVDHELGDIRFLEELHKLGGMSDDLLNNPELARLFVPILRSDIKASNTYHYVERTKMNTPISILFGKEDPLCDHYSEWRNCTDRKCEYTAFDGGHFFIHEKKEEVTSLVNRTILKIMRAEENKNELIY
ncbi:thioesterase II family protein [Paenibacillus pabuli]|uniref:thioesterase II family protein n=1 Tax=Paenibacillus pabuli TaxID=1472 RepID=UPI003CE792A7